MNGFLEPACLLSHLPRSSNETSGNISSSENDDNRNSKEYQPTYSHNRLLPKRFIPPKTHKRHTTLTEIMQWYQGTYFHPKHYDTLSRHENHRMIRSEFREVITIGCAILTYYYDVMTGEIGFRNDRGKWVSIGYHQLAKKLNISTARIKRFFKFLKDRKLITILKGRKAFQNGKWITNISRKIIKPEFFIKTLGIRAWRKITKLKDWIIKKSKNNKSESKHDQENLQMLKGLLGAAQRGNSIQSAVKNVMKRVTKPFGNPDSEKRYIERAKQLYEQDPSRSLTDYYREVKYGK